MPGKRSAKWVMGSWGWVYRTTACSAKAARTGGWFLLAPRDANERRGAGGIERKTRAMELWRAMKPKARAMVSWDAMKPKRQKSEAVYIGRRPLLDAHLQKDIKRSGDTPALALGPPNGPATPGFDRRRRRRGSPRRTPRARTVRDCPVSTRWCFARASRCDRDGSRPGRAPPTW